MYNPWPKTQSNTIAGKSSRVADTMGQNSKMRRALPTRNGIISAIKMQGGTEPIPFVKVKWNDSPDVESKWIPLEDHPMAIAQFYAAKLEDLVGQYTVRVHYVTESSSSGIAKIVGNVTVDSEQVNPQIESSGVKLI